MSLAMEHHHKHLMPSLFKLISRLICESPPQSHLLFDLFGGGLSQKHYRIPTFEWGFEIVGHLFNVILVRGCVV